MELTWKTIIWQQFGAAMDMLESAMRACPDHLWSDPSRRPEWVGRNVVGFWYVAYHTLFWLDFYLSESEEGFVPPAPFTLCELDPSGLLPERPYTKNELQTYLDHGREKCRATIGDLTEQHAQQRRRFPWGEVSGAELLLYNMRHVQHHAAQLHLLLRQTTGSTPGWVAQTKAKPSAE